MANRTKWCQPCALQGREGFATGEVDGEPMCDPCAEHEQRMGVAMAAPEKITAAVKRRWAKRRAAAPMRGGSTQWATSR